MPSTPIEQLKREALALPFEADQASEEFVVYRWQFIEHRFVPAKVFATSTEAWGYVRHQIEELGKDMSRFRVAARPANPLDAMRPPLKPTCDAEGNWRYVPAVSIDGPRAPAHREEAARAERFRVSVSEHNATVSPERRIITTDDAARAAVEGMRMDGVAA